MADTPDLSKIIGLIMENPDLIAKIQSLAKNESEPVTAHTELDATPEPSEEKAVSVGAEYQDPRHRRNKLLYAMKPYLSSERAKAIDSMLSVAEILDMMKSR